MRRVCISNTLLGAARAAGPGNMLRAAGSAPALGSSFQLSPLLRGRGVELQPPAS